ncbi:MAG: FIST N-terminal domain-containing protein [Bacilli bacterium]|nr:FIST N-terminal domain-containing protein [Bacilli bacterium]
MLNSKVGYSKNTDAYEAGKETATKATEGISAKIGLLFNSVGYDQKKLMEGIKSVAKDVDVIGCTSSAGIITPDGYMIDEDGTAGMLTLGGDDLTVACYGMAKGKSARETGREVAKKALEKAGLDYAPDYFFMSASPAEEEEYIKGIQDIIGRVPCFGGSAADNTVEGKWSIFYNDTIFNDGVVAAFFYTANDIATVYTGAYNETKDMGIITKLNDTRVLAEIDGEPALDKYKNWRGLDDEAVTGGNLLVTTITSPLGVKDRLGNLTAIRHPMNGNDDKSMNIGANLAVGTTVIRMEATVDELINSTGKTLKELKKKCPNAAGYLLIHCGGRRLGIGDRMNEVYEQLKKEAGDVPFLVAFTFGEYGYTDDDQTNTTGGLMLSFTAFEK